MTAVRDYRSGPLRFRRRVVSVPAVLAGAPLLTITAPLWAPAAAIADLLRGRRRLPLARLLAFGVVWSWAECAGIARAFGEWVRGNAEDQDRHYALMAWWTGTLMNGLSATTGLRVEVEGVDAFAPVPTVTRGQTQDSAPILVVPLQRVIVAASASVGCGYPDRVVRLLRYRPTPWTVELGRLPSSL